MALKVWLPLNGTLKNKGISNVQIISTGSSIVTNGKIDSCMKIVSDTTLNYIPNFNTTPLSFGGWFKFNQTEIAAIVDSLTYSSTANYPTGNLLGNTSYGGIGLIWYGNNHYTSGAFNSMQVFATLRTSTVNRSTPSFTIEFDEWTHIMATWDPVIHTLSLYKNGTYVGNTIFSTFTDGINKSLILNYRAIFGGNGPATNIPMYCNDIRVYDHCLSAFEIKQISQGLVLHYKLNNPYNENTTNLVSSIASYDYITQNVETYATLIKNKTIYGNKIFTYSAYIKNTSENRLAVRFNPYNAEDSAYSAFMGNYIEPGEEGRSFVTVDITDTSKWNGKAILYIQNGNTPTIPTNRTFQIKEIQLEEKNHMTPFTLNSRNDIVIQDSSGYEHNGTIINTPTIDFNTPRYKSSLHFTATNQHIKCGTINTAGFGNSYSFSWWAKISSTTPMHWGFSNGIRVNGMYTGRLWNTGDSSSNPLYNPGTTTQVTAPTVNIWHHWVMTGDGATCKVYQDGVLWGIAKTYKAISGTQIYINGWDNNTNYCSDNYSISDFRIYCTALSADDIKKLYETSMEIDSNGNILPRILIT